MNAFFPPLFLKGLFIALTREERRGEERKGVLKLLKNLSLLKEFFSFGE
jgi:hypothetical protein